MLKHKQSSWVWGGLLATTLLSCSLTSESPQIQSPAQLQALSQKQASEIEPAWGEVLDPNEAFATREIQANIFRSLNQNYNKPPMTRDVHAKHHGCVKAFFKVQNNSLPPALKVGVFKDNLKEFPAWIRFSNGNGQYKPDGDGDIRGMAIKLMGVPGQKRLPNQANEQTQDFLLINNRTFFLEKLGDYIWFTKAVAEGSSGLAAFAITHPKVAYRLYTIFKQQIGNPLEVDYFSTTPYKLGPSAIKFRARPCTPGTATKPAKPSANYLREAMTQTLNQKSACYEFMVQVRQGSFTEMPVEDATQEWDEKRAPFIPVAQINIPQQPFDSPAQMRFCENLSFTPWHALPEHKPLGAVNRVRKQVYEAISAFRHSHNQVERQEPQNHQIGR